MRKGIEKGERLGETKGDKKRGRSRGKEMWREKRENLKKKRVIILHSSKCSLSSH